MRVGSLDFKVIGWNASYSDSTTGTSCGAITLHNKDVYLLDCGFGALSGMFRKGVVPDRVKGILVTHTHLDHVGGIPELQWYLMNRGVERVLDIVSPEEIPGLPFPVNYVESLLDSVTVPLIHRVPAQGYIVGKSEERSGLAWITDTRPTENIVEAVKGVEVLYHEATYGKGSDIKAKFWGHSTGRQAAEVAKRAGVGKLVLGHFSHAVDPREVLREAREVFPESYLP